ncbi:MAG: flagellar motor protein MotB [Eubacteriales bacterium]|nr:flagellar motor protein MotB [Eubacteriales bacterium]MDD3199903.1 flagellar motor protein MotB [Eubacteriales bacterium]MDD4121532.1 flagellar motor protein MotB [Eubacteriales bacterium]MDD4630412.1 flagellar motor protein MotB [Eubacteriales bacterium]
MARRKKNNAEHDNTERWLLSYADFITLLMIFFVVMYAMSNVDAQKYQVLSESLAGALNPSGPGGTGSGGTSSGSGIDVTQELADGLADKIDPKLIAAAEEITKLIREKNLQDKVSVSVQERGVVVGVMNTVLFDPGSIQIRQEAIPTLIAIGQIANDVHNYIRVEGNTDDVPMNTPQFPSNWELSVSRATQVLKLFIEESNVSPDKISAVGYGEYRPSVPNTSSENRARNRKVDIVILSDAFDKSESTLLDNPDASSETEAD